MPTTSMRPMTRRCCARRSPACWRTRKSDPRRIDSAALRQLATPALADLEAAFDSDCRNRRDRSATAGRCRHRRHARRARPRNRPTSIRKNGATICAPPSGGVGLNLALGAGAVRVVGAIENGPADKAGMVAGDTLVAIDGTPVAGLRAGSGDRPAARAGEIRNRAERRAWPRQAVRASCWCARRCFSRASIPASRAISVFSKLTRLTDQTPPNLGAAIAKIEAAPDAGRLAGYVLDLRDNAGGLLDTAVSVTRMFMDNGLIATTTARGRETQHFEADSAALATARPLAVLIDETHRRRRRNHRRRAAGAAPRRRHRHAVGRRRHHPDRVSARRRIRRTAAHHLARHDAVRPAARRPRRHPRHHRGAARPAMRRSRRRIRSYWPR